MSLINRFFLEISYDGTLFHGWQIQNNADTVQGEVNRVLSVLCEESISVMGCGRTDTGVHATQYFCHFDSVKEMNSENHLHRINKMFPANIAALSLREVGNDAHARFDADSRTYEYHIHKEKSPFLVNRSYQLNAEFDIDLMNKGAALLLYYENFECFSKVHTQVNNFNCNISKAIWEERKEGIVFTITANRFLRNMVRAIVGSLVDLGKERISIEDLIKIIESQNRSNAGMSAPAHALYLSSVTYPYIN
ncbi:MAG: tRNA pseudouridine(38-40) synthase TruA [Flavobacteriales bacterium]|nr:tRNA pseudouridine(38-40) synthase TruA [Flavobacteriales bacterium]